MEEKLTIKNDVGENLSIIKSVPTQRLNKFPTIILVHGFGSDANSDPIQKLAREFTNKGYLTYRFSFSGCGESEGDYSEMTLSKEVSELDEIISFVRKQPEVDLEKIGIFAHSFGTASAIVLNPKVKAIILASPSYRMDEFFRNRYKDDYHLDSLSCWVKPSTGANICLGPKFWLDIDKYNLVELVKLVKVPTLIIHGDNDKTILPSESEILFKELDSDKKRIIIKNADHKFQPNFNGINRETIKWFEKYLMNK